MSALRHAVFRLECEVLLGEVAERDHNDSSKHLRNGGVQMEVLNKEFDENVIEKNTQYHQQKIPEKLNPSPQYGTRENDMPV